MCVLLRRWFVSVWGIVLVLLLLLLPLLDDDTYNDILHQRQHLQ